MRNAARSRNARPETSGVASPWDDETRQMLVQNPETGSFYVPTGSGKMFFFFWLFLMLFASFSSFLFVVTISVSIIIWFVAVNECTIKFDNIANSIVLFSLLIGAKFILFSALNLIKSFKLISKKGAKITTFYQFCLYYDLISQLRLTVQFFLLSFLLHCHFQVVAHCSIEIVKKSLFELNIFNAYWNCSNGVVYSFQQIFSTLKLEVFYIPIEVKYIHRSIIKAKKKGHIKRLGDWRWKEGG